MITKDRHGPWALILGGSEGIGEELAAKLGVLGIHLVLVARKPGPLAETAARVRAASHVDVRTLSLDIAREDALERLREVTDGLEVGLLVHNVAGIVMAPLLDQPLDDALRPVMVNCINQVKFIRHYGRPMKERRHGGILMFGSISGTAGGARLAAYSAAKSFSQTLAEALWGELEPFGVDVLNLVVSSVDSPAKRRAGSNDDTGTVPLDQPADMAQQAIERIGDGPVLAPIGSEALFEKMIAMPRREAASMMRSLLSQMTFH